MKWCHNIYKACLITGFIIIISSCKEKEDKTYLAIKENHPSKLLAQRYDSLTATCASQVAVLEKQLDTVILRNAYKEARNTFKRLEPILGFHDLNNYQFLNAPNILKVEEEDATDIKAFKPRSFQTLEETLFENDPDVDEVKKIASVIQNRLRLLNANIDFNHYKSYHLMWLIRKQLVRVATTGLSGFDSPMLAASLEESAVSLQECLFYLESADLATTASELNDLKQQLSDIINQLQTSDYSTFNRYDFIKTQLNPSLKIWKTTVHHMQLVFPVELALNVEAVNLFSEETLSLPFFATSTIKTDSLSIDLGKRLFNDTRMSANNMVSCATCHNATLAFTDGIKNPKGLTRNSPSLTYAAYQQAFFYDKRTGNLEGQILDVVNNDKEFHSSIATYIDVIKQDVRYKYAFAKAYNDTIVKESNVRAAIANYVRSLNSWDSKLDRNMRLEENTYTSSETNGFNLFHGKALCATCHFAPVFNGTVPPDFAETELELLGVPSTAVNKDANIDKDLGRFNIYNTPNRKYFFKTPSLRNVAVTTPYMHNGVYNNLEEVIDFYNCGGGYGIGIDLEYQTLPQDSLNLSDKEQVDLIAFLKTLTDLRYEKAL